MMKPFSILFLICSLLVTGSVFIAHDVEASVDRMPSLAEKGKIVKREDVSELDLVLLHLANGMKVCLKKTGSEEEMVIRLSAAGGYTSLPESQRASGQLASQIAIRSGVGNYHFDQLHALLYDHSIDFNSEVQAFCRSVEGTAFMSDADFLMSLINQFFTQHHFTEHSFRKVMQKEKEKIANRAKRAHRNFEETYMDFNTPNVSAFSTMNVEDIDRADFKTSKTFFENSFRDPSEFSCVIAGSFEMEKMVALVEKHLATIPKVDNHLSVCKIPDFPQAYKGVKTKIVPNQVSNKESRTVFTFPVKTLVTNENFVSIENIALLMHIRLKNVLRERYGMESVLINVSTEYPLYPSLASPWIKIQYFTDPKFATPMGQTILEELSKMKQEGVSADEIAVMNRKYGKAQHLHEKDNYYWVMVLSNYVMWKWDPKKLPRDLKPLVEEQKIRQALQSYFSLDNYSIITAQP